MMGNSRSPDRPNPISRAAIAIAAAPVRPLHIPTRRSAAWPGLPSPAKCGD